MLFKVANVKNGCLWPVVLELKSQLQIKALVCNHKNSETILKL